MSPEALEKLPALLFEIGKLIGSDLDPGILLSRIAELICQLIDAKACSVMLLDADRKRLLAKAGYGLRTERMHSLSFRVGVVTATAERTGAFNANHLELVRFISMTIALDIENVRLHRVAVTDPLTGAYNREFLVQRLPQEIEAAIDRDRSLSLAMIDVDHFKAVNDQYGHGVGDVVLAEVARRLRRALRAGA